MRVYTSNESERLPRLIILRRREQKDSRTLLVRATYFRVCPFESPLATKGEIASGLWFASFAKSRDINCAANERRAGIVIAAVYVCMYVCMLLSDVVAPRRSTE